VDPRITTVTRGGGGQPIRKPDRANTGVNVGTGQYGADDLQGLWIAAERQHSDSIETWTEVSTNWKDERGNILAQLSRTECFWFDVTNYFTTLFTDVFALALHDPVPAISC